MTATSALGRVATPEERTAMLRAMLADRFKLVIRFEPRERPVYDLVLARADGRLGPGLKPSATDCEAKFAADRAAAEAAIQAGTPPQAPPRADPNAPPPPCTLRNNFGRVDGEGPISSLAQLLRFATGREIVDKTGLKGTYTITISTSFDMVASRVGPAAVPSATDSAQSVFTAVGDLGLRLESSTAVRETLVIERLERPTEN